MVFSAENMRMLVLLAFGTCGFLWLKMSLLKELDEKIIASNNALDAKITSSYTALYTQLKTNDFKHLNDTIEELTFMLEKNGYLSPEDKRHIDGRLDN